MAIEDHPAVSEPDADGYKRRGKVFSVRLSHLEREVLEQLQREARDHLPWERRRSLGGFIVWASLQWKPPTPDTKPRDGRGADGTVYRAGRAVARRVKTKRPGRGNTRRPGGRRPKAKAKKKARR